MSQLNAGSPGLSYFEDPDAEDYAAMPPAQERKRHQKRTMLAALECVATPGTLLSSGTRSASSSTRPSSEGGFAPQALPARRG